MISMTLRVTTDGNTEDVVIGPKVQVAFEREWKIGLPKAFGAEQRLEYVYWLAWKAIGDSGRVVKLFDAWLETVENVEMIGADEAPL